MYSSLRSETQSALESKTFPKCSVLYVKAIIYVFQQKLELKKKRKKERKALGDKVCLVLYFTASICIRL